MNEVIVDWETFKQRFLKELLVFVIEEDDKFCFYTYAGPFIVKSELIKPDDSVDLMLLRDEFYFRDNIVRAKYEEKEVEDEDLYDEYFTDDGDYDE